MGGSRESKKPGRALTRPARPRLAKRSRWRVLDERGARPVSETPMSVGKGAPEDELALKAYALSAELGNRIAAEDTRRRKGAATNQASAEIRRARWRAAAIPLLAKGWSQASIATRLHQLEPSAAKDTIERALKGMKKKSV